jgi:hypothetical protein
MYLPRPAPRPRRRRIHRCPTPLLPRMLVAARPTKRSGWIHTRSTARPLESLQGASKAREMFLAEGGLGAGWAAGGGGGGDGWVACCRWRSAWSTYSPWCSVPVCGFVWCAAWVWVSGEDAGSVAGTTCVHVLWSQIVGFLTSLHCVSSLLSGTTLCPVRALLVWYSTATSSYGRLR